MAEIIPFSLLMEDKEGTCPGNSGKGKTIILDYSLLGEEEAFRLVDLP